MFFRESQSDVADLSPQNIVTVPPNCRPGQQWINGSCRDIWRSLMTDTKNVITVPNNCPSGQEFINGQCRDVWKRFVNFMPNAKQKLRLLKITKKCIFRASVNILRLRYRKPNINPNCAM